MLNFAKSPHSYDTVLNEDLRQHLLLRFLKAFLFLVVAVEDVPLCNLQLCGCGEVMQAVHSVEHLGPPPWRQLPGCVVATTP